VNLRGYLRFAAAGLGGVALGGRAGAQMAPTAADLNQLKQLSLDQLTETEVSSVSRYPEKLLDATSAIEVISNDDLERYGAATLPDALRLADNLEVAQKDPHDWAISARGFNSNLGDKMLVLIDGRTVYSPLFSGVFWNAQDYLLEDVDHIEVISGPGGTLWGANAVNGVINVTTKSAQATQGTYLEAGGGTGLQDFVGGRYGGTLAPNVYFRVYGKYLGAEDSTLADGADGNDAWHQAQGGFRLDAQTSLQDSFTLQGDFYSGNEGIESGDAARIAGGNLLGRWSHTVSDTSDLSLQLYWDRTHLADPFAASPFAPAGFLIDDLNTYDLDFQHHLRLGAQNQVVWGAGYRFMQDDVGQEAPNFGFQPPRWHEGVANLFAQDEIEVATGVFVTLGSKLEHNGYTGLEVEPDVRLRWALTPAQTLWAAVSRAVRTPSRLDRSLTEPSPPLTLIEGGANFESETMIAYELGYRAQLGPQMDVSVSNFYNTYNDLRSLSTTPVTLLPLVYENGLAARTYGTEISADYEVRPEWRLHAGYDWLHEHVWVKPGQVDFESALDETEDPRNQFSVRSSLDLPRDLDLDTTLRFVDSLRVNNGGTPAAVPSYFECDARLGWRVSRHCELSLVGENLLHANHPEFGPPGPEQEQIGRSLFGRAVWRY
jgi:iron complex outermembrane receptor protein